MIGWLLAAYLLAAFAIVWRAERWKPAEVLVLAFWPITVPLGLVLEARRRRR